MRNLSNVLRLLGAFTVLSVLAGVLAAGLAIPAVGATGTAAKGGASLFNELPSDISASPLNVQSRILDADGKVIATPYSENRILVDLKNIAPIMQQAQIAIEDSRFYEHGALDPRGLSRALVETAQGNTQGASTLTQQYVKLTLQENARLEDDQAGVDAATARNGVAGVARKLRELRYAVQLEDTMTKDKILESYLNLAYYGDQAYGVEAAAQHYFSIPASKLNYVQAALLAGTVQQPGKTDPVNFPDAAKERRDVVLDRMAELAIITPAQAEAGKKVAIKSMLKVKESQNTCQRSSQPYYCQYVMEWLKAQPALGKDATERLKNINTKGLTIQTPLKTTWSQAATKMITEKVPYGDPSGVGAAATVVEPGTGKVVAMGQSSTFDKNQVNWNVDEAYGGSIGFQVGSTAKTFALVAALEAGIPVNGSVRAKSAGPGATQGANYFHSDNTDNCNDWTQPWNVRNDYNDGGTITLKRATRQSINTAFASLTMQLGICTVQGTMTKLGMHNGNGQPTNKLPTSVLGASETTPVTIAASYAALAADGVYCNPIPVTSVKTPDGKAIPVDGANCKQVVSPDVARGVTQLLTEPFKAGGTAQRSDGHIADGRPEAGKTGTTDDHIESWFVGYTPQYAAAVYVGTPNSQREMDRITIGGRYYPNVFGSTLAGPLWADIMGMVLQGQPKQAFTPPSDKVNNGNFVTVPSVVGMSVDAARAALTAAGFRTYDAGRQNSTIAAGLVSGTTASGRALEKSSIGLFTSTGYVPPPPPRTATAAPTTPATRVATPPNRNTGPATPRPKPTNTRG